MLNKNRDKIVEAFAALKKVATVASHVLAQTKVDFAEDLKSLYPVIKALADNRKNFIIVAADPADVPVPELRHQAGGPR